MWLSLRRIALFSLLLSVVCRSVLAMPSISAQINAAYPSIDWASFDSQYVYDNNGKKNYSLGLETDLDLRPFGSVMLGGMYFPQVKYHSEDNKTTGKRDAWLLYLGSNWHYSFGTPVTLGLRLGMSYHKLYNEVTVKGSGVTTNKGQAFSPLAALYLHYSFQHYFLGLEYWHFMARNTSDKLQDGTPAINLAMLSLGYRFEL